MMKRKMRWLTAGVCLAVLLLVPVLSVNVQAAYYSTMNYSVQVSSSEGKINVRSGPGTDYYVVGEAYNGMVLNISEMQYNPYDGFMWGACQFNGSRCWISLRNTIVMYGAGYLSPDFYVLTAGSGGAVNLRSAAGTAYPVLLEIPNGVELHVMGLVYNSMDGFFWGSVTYNGYTGWISLRQTNLNATYNSPTGIVYGNSGYTPAPTYGSVYYSRNGEVNLRRNPSYNSPLVGTVYGGTPMYYYGENGFGYGSDGYTHEWFYVTLNNGVSGWVRSDLIW